MSHTPKNILLYKMVIPPQQFPLIAHLYKWLTSSDGVEVSPGFMVLDGQKYTDGLVISYMTQVHDMIMLRDVDALIAANINYHGYTARMWVRVDEYMATLEFFKLEG